jgi:hypothetical protein
MPNGTKRQIMAGGAIGFYGLKCCARPPLGHAGAAARRRSAGRILNGLSVNSSYN